MGVTFVCHFCGKTRLTGTNWLCQQKPGGLCTPDTFGYVQHTEPTPPADAAAGLKCMNGSQLSPCIDCTLRLGRGELPNPDTCTCVAKPLRSERDKDLNAAVEVQQSFVCRYCGETRTDDTRWACRKHPGAWFCDPASPADQPDDWTPHYVRSLGREWQRRLGLADWTINYLLVSPDTLPKGAVADITRITVFKRKAIIRLADPEQMAPEPWDIDLQPETSIVHELLHLHLEPIKDALDRIRASTGPAIEPLICMAHDEAEDATERAIYHLSKALVALKRGETPCSTP